MNDTINGAFVSPEQTRLPNPLHYEMAPKPVIRPNIPAPTVRFFEESKPTPRPNLTEFDPYVESLLKGIARGKQVLQLQKDTPAFAQGDPANAVYFIQSGKVKLSVVSLQGKEAILAMLGPRESFGEGCLIGQAFRISTAITTESSVLFRVEKQAMLQALNNQPHLSEQFTAAVVARNINLEEDLCDQLFNYSERRLARVLLKLSRLGQVPGMPNAKITRLRHETLAEMVGITRSRINFFMNKFRKLGLIEYKGTGDITVRNQLLADIVLYD